MIPRSYKNDSSENSRAAEFLLALPVENWSTPVLAFGAFLMLAGGLSIAKFFLIGTGAGALATWLAVKTAL